MEKKPTKPTATPKPKPTDTPKPKPTATPKPKPTGITKKPSKPTSTLSKGKPPEKSPSITGLIWHEDMMLHAPPGYPTQGHCENPERLRSIIKKLTSCSSSTQPNVEIITKFPEATPTLVNDAHGPKGLGMYYDYIKKIYDPKDQGGGDIYANEHTSRAI